MVNEGQSPLGGSGEGANPPTNPPEVRTRITAEAVRQKQQERESKYVELMDAMEASVREKGQYFVKFGDKNKGVDGKTDTRALLLIKSAVDPKDGTNLFIVITRDGRKGLRFIPQDKNPQDQDEKQEEQMKSTIEYELHYQQMPESEKTGINGINPSDDGFLSDGILRISKSRSADNPFRFPSGDNEVRSVDLETAKEAIIGSQNVAEIPHFLKLEEEQQKIEDAKNLLDIVNQLPRKQ